jgi:hypothetical protein
MPTAARKEFAMDAPASSENFLFEDLHLAPDLCLKQSYDIAAGIHCDQPGATHMLMTQGLEANAA